MKMQWRFYFLSLIFLKYGMTLSLKSEVISVDGTERSCFREENITALVLARCGSKGIPLKNLAKIGGESLLRRTLRLLYSFGKFSSIWVSTDCNKIHHEALLGGAKVHRRSMESASDSASSIIAIKEFLQENSDVKIVGLFQCTSPFLALPFIHYAFSLIHHGYDSVFSVTREHKLRWQISPDGQVSPLNFDPTQRPRRQDWKGEIIENGMFYFTHRDLVTQGFLQGGRIAVVEVPSNCSLEIDSREDLDVAAGRLRQRAQEHTC